MSVGKEPARGMEECQSRDAGQLRAHTWAPSFPSMSTLGDLGHHPHIESSRSKAVTTETTFPHYDEGVVVDYLQCMLKFVL